MLSLVARRMSQAILVLFVVSVLSFILFQFAGDPVSQMVGMETSAADRDRLRQELGLNDPIIIQFGRFIWSILQFDFGFSYQFKRPVVDLIAETLPATFELAGVAAILAVTLGIVFGVLTGVYRNSWLSHLLMSVSLLGISLPVFFIGILLIYIFAVQLQWLPSFGRGEVVQVGWWSTGFLTKSGLLSLILPALTLTLYKMTLIMRLVRAEMLEVLRADYIRFARARGLKARTIYFRSALKNTLVPVMTVVGLQLGSMIAFGIIVEMVFQWPGMGLLFLQAVQNVDIPVMATYLLLVAFIFVTINLVVDILYAFVDPRLRTRMAE